MNLQSVIGFGPNLKDLWRALYFKERETNDTSAIMVDDEVPT